VQQDNIISGGSQYRYLHGNIIPCVTFETIADKYSSGRICGWEILLKDIKYKKILFGEGYSADKKLLKIFQKTSSNSFINLLYNSGIFALLSYLIFFFYLFYKKFNFQFFVHDNKYVVFSSYVIMYIIFRAFFEDTITFLNIDLILILNSILLINKISK
jgi:hypothetical protein